MSRAKIAIVGGGVAGVTAALTLKNFDLDITLFEKQSSLVGGPPFCHLHAGGNLYREISDAQCIRLLKESIDFLRFYPFAVDFRPTVIAVPVKDSGDPKDLLDRLEVLKSEYKKLIEKEHDNKVLGEPQNYYKLYDRIDLEALKNKEPVNNPKSLEEWLIPVAKYVNLESIKYPLIIVQEYGLNLFRVAAGATLALQKAKNVDLKLSCEIVNITQKKEQFFVSYRCGEKSETKQFDYLINAAGFNSGVIDDMLGFKRERLIEFKAAYVTKWEDCNIKWPEIIFHGKRGTPQGMAQFTPYPDGYFQLHGMTKEITLFNDGLVKNPVNSSQPRLNQKFLDKIYKGWKKEDIEKRTKKAIKHFSCFIPEFAKNAKVASKPLFGAQQIPGDDPDLRAAEISFEGDRYARCEIVKVSSALSMTDEIVKKLIELKMVDSSYYGKRDYSYLKDLEEKKISELAKEIAKKRGYPTSMANRVLYKI